MRSSTFASLIAIAFAASTPLASAQEWTPEKQQVVDSFGNVAVNGAPGVPAQTPSMAVGISINGTPVVQKGYGGVLGAPAGPETLYRLASVSKQFTAATLLAIIEESSGPMAAGGKSPANAKISLDTPLSKLIEEAAMFSKGPVTLRQMLNMQSGFATYTSPPAGLNQPYDPTKPIKPAELLRMVVSMLAQNKAPGGAQPYFYSNTNYLLAAVAMERFMNNSIVTGGNVNYRDLVMSRVFKKAGMTKTGFIEQNFTGVQVAPPGVDTTNIKFTRASWPKGAGEVVSTATDMLKWHKALMTNQIISENARNAMFQPKAAMGNNTFYAMGWTVVVVPPFVWVSHGGEIGGFSPADGIFLNVTTGKWVSVVVLANNDKVASGNLATCFAQLAMDPAKTAAGWSLATKQACLLPTKGLPGG